MGPGEELQAFVGHRTILIHQLGTMGVACINAARGGGGGTMAACRPGMMLPKIDTNARAALLPA
jgi:hypothetical protein